MRTSIRPVRLLLIVVQCVAITLLLLYLGEYFGWRWVREAGGLILSANPGQVP